VVLQLASKKSGPWTELEGNSAHDRSSVDDGNGVNVPDFDSAAGERKDYQRRVIPARLVRAL